MLDILEKIIIKMVNGLGRILSVLLLLMVLNVSWDVMMRYLFHNSSVGMQEMEWHLFAVIILFGISVALKDEGHVRVDFLFDKFSPRKKAIVNIIGTLFFLIPLALLIFGGSLEFVRDAYETHEISEDPGGLPFRWVIKGMIPLSFGFLIISAIGYILQNVRKLREIK
ncbi:C4-dicarboxylate ABC transporter [Desulfolithobacter dissulfuricans]|uniref:C4-dicarboxylate ABC transporter n=2 Tax=Desulfolithobacter dissulfuricans TaxID=2795293 RepID=A0A915U1R3_9BACT|nr:C4-dicarboxylate ABC transporter [Desulfolithobacter dissulfuricans]